MKDQKHRNAYKRYWRNHKNWEKHLSEMHDASVRSRRSFRLMAEAEREMSIARS